MEALGVTDHRFLGGAGRFRDSGMVWASPHQRAEPPTPSGWPTSRGGRASWSRSSARCAPGAGHVRRRRWLRPPRPRPGAPGGDVRGVPSSPPTRRTATGARPGTSRRSTGARCPRAGCARQAPAARSRRHHLRSRGWTPRPTMPSFAVPDELVTATDRRRGPRRRPRWPRCARTPPRSRSTGRSSRSRQPRQPVWGIEYYRLVQGSPGTERDEPAARRTCSPASTRPTALRGSRSVSMTLLGCAERVMRRSQPGEPGLRGVPCVRSGARLPAVLVRQAG